MTVTTLERNIPSRPLCSLIVVARMSQVESKTVPLSEVDPAMIVAGMKSQPVESPKPSDGPVSGDAAEAIREYDVVCEKGRGDHERFVGNRFYRALINKYKDDYNDLAPVERSEIIGNIISAIKDRNGWFVQREEEGGKWGELNEEKVRKKVSDDLRREVRRRREKRSNSTMFSAKLKALKEMEEDADNSRDILQPVNDPRQADVLFGPGARRHPGNKTYWRLMKMNLDRYIISPYGARSMISRSIVQAIRDQHHGRFLEQDTKTAIWYEISDKRAIEKTSHALSNKKYKTRKRHPDEAGDQHPSFSGGDHHDVDDEGSDCFSDSKESIPSQSSDDSQSRAKVMSKKFRLLKRMVGPEMDDEDKESIPHAANILVMGFPRRESGTSLTAIKKPDSPSSPPIITKERQVIVSPMDSRASTISEVSRDDYHEYDSRYRGVPRRVPSVPEAGPPGDYHYHRPAEMGPRLGHYDAYADEEHYYKRTPSSPFVGHHMHGEYAPVRRYVVDHHGPPPPPPIDAEYLSPRAAAGPHPHHSPRHSPSYAASGMPPSAERGVLKPRSTSTPGGGYWVRAEQWGSPSARRADQYTGWH